MRIENITSDTTLICLIIIKGAKHCNLANKNYSHMLKGTFRNIINTLHLSLSLLSLVL